MRKIGAYFALAALTAVIVSPQPAAAFGLRIGPFHIGLPFYWHRHHPLYMRATPNDLTRPDSAQGASQGQSSVLLYPSLALPAMFENIFWPAYSSSWPFGYQAIFATAFAKMPPDQDPHLCQPSVDATGIVGRISAEIAPSADQMQLLQKLGGALGAASGYLAKSCPSDIPTQPTARLQLMQSQIEELSMALDIVRQPLQDFEQSLNSNQQAKFAAVAGSPTVADQNRPDNFALSCGGSPTTIDWSVDQIEQSVQPTDAQHDALTDVRRAFGKAASDLASHCPSSSSLPPTALGRLETIETRLDSTWRAVLSIQVALAGFETKLSDDQRNRLDAMNFAAAR
jgi:LTXXQ motif family protein